VNVLASIIFFVAIAAALSYAGIIAWVTSKFAWFFHHTFGISGAESVVAVAAPFLGQAETAVLVRNYVPTFSRSEFHLLLTSGFAAIAGTLLNTYIHLGVPGAVLVSSSVMSIPGTIAASKIIYPETQEVETATLEITLGVRPEIQDEATGVLHSFSRGAWLGVKIAGLIFANVLVLLSMVYVINGLLAYIGTAWYITDSNGGPLSLELIIGYLLWPLTYMLGVPRVDVLRVSQLIATKIIANEVSTAFSSPPFPPPHLFTSDGCAHTNILWILFFCFYSLLATTPCTRSSYRPILSPDEGSSLPHIVSVGLGISRRLGSSSV
jgi:CNT family concentrative nucleoside transporter